MNKLTEAARLLGVAVKQSLRGDRGTAYPTRAFF
jgi:hypothetical protein